MIVEEIKKRVTDSLQPEHIEIIDHSAAHAGHAGAMESGGGHYHAIIVSNAFTGKTLVQRHQLVYRALGDMMKNEIHALGIDALSPEENNKGK